MKLNTAKSFLLAMILIISTQQSFAEVERSSLGLEGSSLQGLASSSDGSLVLAGAEGPQGLYFSQDFGESWIFASGGEYSSGSAVGVACVNTKAYALLEDGALYTATLPTDTTSTWNPNWSEIGNIGSNATLKTAGNYLLFGNRGNSIEVLDTTNDTFVEQSAALSDEHNIKVAIATGNMLYAFSEVTQEGSERASYLYKATWDNSTGSSGDYTEISRASAGLPTTDSIWNIAVAPTGEVYVGFSSETPGSSITYVSADSGVSFTATSVQTHFNGSCFGTDVRVVGTFASNNGGTSWVNLGDKVVSETGRMEDTACTLNPIDNNQALFGSNRGTLKTVNLVTNFNAPTFAESYEGMEGIIVKATSQASDNADRVVLGTSGGVAFSDDFTADDPDWIFPICPGGDCVGGERVILDTNNTDHIYYASGNIRRGVITGTGDTIAITWEDFSNKPDENFNIRALATYSFFPGKVIIGYYEQGANQDGGLYIYDTTTTNAEEITDSNIANKPISAFIALDANTLFAAVGAFSDYPETDLRYIARSIDGGLTWEKMTDTDLSETLLVSDFAYDEDADVLYASTSQNPGANGGEAEAGTVYILQGAKEGLIDWSEGGEFTNSEGEEQALISFTALAVDPTTSNVYAAGDRYIWVSADSGATWNLFYEGLPDEATYSLFFEPETEIVNAAFSASPSQRFGLTQASQTGVYSFADGELPVCTLVAAKRCKKRVPYGTRCKLTAQVSNILTNSAISDASISLQRNRRNRSRGWKRKGRKKTTSTSGSKVFRFKAKQSGYYRISATDLNCTSEAVRIRVKR